MGGDMRWLTAPRSSPDREDALRVENGKSWIENAREARTAEWNALLERMHPLWLWENGAPGYQPEYKQRPPAIYRWPDASHEAPSGAILISAGGGYMFKSEWEAEPVARWFYEKGFSTFIVDYRVAPYTLEESRADALRAVRYLRYHAETLNILPDRIAVLGGSAGGQQSGMAATMFDEGDLSAEDPVERVSSRPDACVLCYGAWIVEAEHTPIAVPFDWEAQKEKAQYSVAHHLRVDCPPFFIWQTNADDPRHGCEFCIALTNLGIPFEFHVFPEGAHGCGLADGGHRYAPYARSASRWPMMVTEFLENLGFLPKTVLEE